ncbi:hypothetical protein Hanom_Chr09g00791651 [Helianthus anomalus]
MTSSDLDQSSNSHDRSSDRTIVRFRVLVAQTAALVVYCRGWAGCRIRTGCNHPHARSSPEYACTPDRTIVHCRAGLLCRKCTVVPFNARPCQRPRSEFPQNVRSFIVSSGKSSFSLSSCLACCFRPVNKSIHG